MSHAVLVRINSGALVPLTADNDAVYEFATAEEAMLFMAGHILEPLPWQVVEVAV